MGVAKAQEAAIISERLRRGSSIFVFGDFLAESPEELVRNWGLLGAARRQVHMVQVLDPSELDFPFSGNLQFFSSQKEKTIESNAERARATYLKNLQAHLDDLSLKIKSAGFDYSLLRTDESPADDLRKIVSLQQ